MRQTTPTRAGFGMPVIDVHQQVLGHVILRETGRLIILQRLGQEQLVAVPLPCVAAVVDGAVMLTVTPGELEILGQVIETRRDHPHLFRALGPRGAAPSAA